MRFAKGHGTGNDFVILPDPDGVLPLTPAFVAALCDRRRGIGADGVLRVVRSAAHPDAAASAGDAEWFMDYWNADGSHRRDVRQRRPRLRPLPGRGRAGRRRGRRSPWPPAPGWSPVTIGDEIAAGHGRCRELSGPSEATVDGRRFAGTAVDVGNPHLVCPVDEPTLDGST